MPSAQIHTQKARATPKAAGRSVIAAGKPKQGNSETRPGAGPSISAQERQRLIARAAYFRAEKRGFAPGSELQDWIEAEAEVLQLIRGG